MQLIVILLKKTVYDKVVYNVNTIETSEFVLKMQYNTNKLYLEKKIDYADTNIANTSGHVKKIDDAKTSETDSKYFTTFDYNKFTCDTFDAKIKERGLVDKSTITVFMNNADLNKKIVTLAAKAELKSKENKIIKLEALFL